MTTSAAPRGILTLEERDADGRLLRRWVNRNSWTLLGATEVAKALNGEAATLQITAIALGAAGFTIHDCNTAWTNGSLDTVTFMEGTGSNQITCAANGTITATSPSITAADASALTDIELYLRLLLRGNVNTTTTKLRVYSGSDYFECTFGAIETALGAQLQDGVWSLCRVPKASFTTGSGSPVWTGVTGAGIELHATSAGTATVNADDVRAFGAPDLTSAATALANDRIHLPVTMLSRSNRTVTCRSSAGPAAAVGQWYCAGLFAGAVPLAVTHFADGDTTGVIGAYKALNNTLLAIWTVEAAGGTP